VQKHRVKTGFYIMQTIIKQVITKKPKVIILATGGTIAGSGEKAYGSIYEAGQIDICDLLKSVPEIDEIAEIDGEQIANIGSQDMDSEIWLLLAKRINALLAFDDVTGIVITHGTDTMEETAYFLNLVINSNKPVVLTGSMRPATARSADGPNNLFDAVVVACSETAKGRGVMITVNEKIFGAHDVSKVATTHIDAFVAPNYGPLGHVSEADVEFYRLTERVHTKDSVFSNVSLKSLPEVPILYGYVSCLPALIDCCIASGAQGIVFAGTGNGNIPKNLIKKVLQLKAKGIILVRSSRACYGAITAGEVDDDSLGTIASSVLNPQKARILLQLALTQTNDPNVIKEYFKKY